MIQITLQKFILKQEAVSTLFSEHNGHHYILFNDFTSFKKLFLKGKGNYCNCYRSQIKKK